MAPRYQPLAAFLAAQPPETTRLTLTFAQVGALVGGRLPPSVWGKSWWANTPHTGHGRAWLGAGWRVAQVSISGGREAVMFVRTDAT